MVVEKELSFKSNKIKLEGNLCLPDNNKPKAVVLLLPGSGPVDRDENVKNGINKFISNNLKTIAYQLAKHKIASFRYDKRGVNKTKKLDKDVGFNDILNDARNAVKFLKKL